MKPESSNLIRFCSVTTAWLILALGQSGAGKAQAADISGAWKYSIESLGDVNHTLMFLTNNGGNLSGTLSDLILVGSVSNSQISISVKRPNGSDFGSFAGRLENDRLKGQGKRGNGDKFNWEASRALPRPASPQVHVFNPTNFHRLFSETIEPAIHIFPGDTVRTWTVDSGGIDKDGVRRCPGGNPQTGPFYIEEAMPRDTLVVKFTKIRLNRSSANSGTSITVRAMTPEFLQKTKYDDSVDGAWFLDLTNEFGRLKNPPVHLKDYRVPLRPFLGCIGVAPARHEAFRTGHLGPYGGNLDYNQLREGTTMYLPVSVPGALLFIGDGHAAQGDGELTGDALETSMDVEFTVDLIRGQQRVLPLAENDEYLMACGIGSSLHEALQIATSELAWWLERDYKLEPNESALILGTAMEYNVAEVVDPEFHLVAKVRKSVLTMPRNQSR